MPDKDGSANTGSVNNGSAIDSDNLFTVDSRLLKTDEEAERLARKPQEASGGGEDAIERTNPNFGNIHYGTPNETDPFGGVAPPDPDAQADPVSAPTRLETDLSAPGPQGEEAPVRGLRLDGGDDPAVLDPPSVALEAARPRTSTREDGAAGESASSAGGVGLEPDNPVAQVQGGGAGPARIPGDTVSARSAETLNRAGLDVLDGSFDQTAETTPGPDLVSDPPDVPDTGTPDPVTPDPVNGAPTGIRLEPVVPSVSEATDTSSRLKVADIIIADDGLGSNALSLSGADADAFEIIGEALFLKAGTVLDFETKSSLDVTVRADDAEVGGSPDATVAFSLAVADANDAPLGLTITGGTVAENATAGTVVGRLETIDPDSSDSFSYQIVDASGTPTDHPHFEIVGDEVRVKAGASFDFETDPQETLRIQVTDSGGLTHTDSVTLDIADVNETPTGILLETLSMTENNNGTDHILLNVRDPDGDAAFTFSVSDSRFEVHDDDGEYTLRLKPGETLDHETEPTVDLEITATDPGGAAYTQNFTLTITDVNEAPTAVTLENGLATNGGFEDLSGEYNRGWGLSTTQTDGWTLVDGPALEIVVSGHGGIHASEGTHWLDLDASPGNITVEKAFDSLIDGETYRLTFDTASRTSSASSGVEVLWNGEPVATITDDTSVWQSHAFDLEAGSGDGSNTLTFRGLGTEDNVGTSLDNVQLTGPDATIDVLENAAGATLGRLTVSDPDQGDTHTFSVSDQRFEVVDGALKLKDGEALDFERDPTLSLDVTATDAGGLSTTQSFTIGVGNVDDTPSDLLFNHDPVLGPDLVVNGSFESPNVGSLANFKSIDGWTADTGVVQIHDNFGGHTASDGRQYLDTDGEARPDAVYQDIATQAGRSYQLSFDTADRIGHSTNAFSVYWNDAKIADIDPASTDWDSMVFTVEGTGGRDRLEFRDEGVDDAFGALVDNVQLREIITEGSPAIAETAPAGTVVATLDTIDPDNSTSFTYQLVDGSDNPATDPNFEIIGNMLVVKPGAVLDFETDPSPTVRIQVSDSEGNVYSDSLTISVTDADETPNVINSASYNDAIVGSDGIDHIYGDSGEEIIYALGGNDIILSDTNQDRILGGDGDDQITGGAQEDFVVGGHGDDVVSGAGGNDYFVYQVGNGNDVIDGGAGATDVLILRNAEGDPIAPDDISIDLATGSSKLSGDHYALSSDASGTVTFADGGVVSFSNLEQIAWGDSYSWDNGNNQLEFGSRSDDSIATGNDEDVVMGGDGNDRLSGGSNEDLLLGEGGDDILDGGTQNDVLIGGAGSDLFVFREGDGFDSVIGGAGGGWTDVIELQNAAGTAAPADTWLVEIDGGAASNTSSADGFLDLGSDASGTITMSNGDQIDFIGIERIEW